MPRHAGGCLCGAVRYETDREPVRVRACWCRVCQYLAAGNASINVVFPRDGLVVTGDTRAYLSTADSGNAMRRQFCPECGTHLFSESSARPEFVVVRAGTLDERESVAPEAVIWTASKPSWGWCDDSLPASPGQAPIVPQ